MPITSWRCSRISGTGAPEIDASDQQLVEAALAGTDDAFGKLVGRYRDGLFRFLLLRCATPADAEDALQDTLVNAWRYLASYDPRWRFSTWLYRIAVRNAHRERVVAGEGIDELAAAGDDPLADCMAQSERENLWLAARRVLSRDAYSATWMYYVDDLPVADIAMALGRSRSWTRVALLRSRRRLSKEIHHAATD